MKASVRFSIPSLESIVSAFQSSFRELQKKSSRIYLSPQSITDIKTAFVEAVANAIKHAKELEKNGSVEGRFFMDDTVIGFEVYDHGKGYDMAAIPIPDLSDFAASGRGVFMMKQLGDDVSYKSSGGKNTLSFIRHLVGQDESIQGLDLLYELSEAIISHASLDEVYQIILERALKLFRVERASILIYDEDLKALKMVASRGIDGEVQNNIRVQAGEGVSGYVFQHGRSLLIEDIDENKRGIEKKEHYKTKSFISAPMICSPLRIDEKPIGVINLTDRADGKKFSKKDLKLLSTIANQAMACLYIRGMVDKIKQAEGLRQEMEQVRLIQESYLPDQAPKIKGYDLAGRCEMAQSVGGDYFDFVMKNDRLYLMVADVSGHNTRSAVTMVNFRSQLRAFLSFETDPAKVLTQLNQSLYEDLSGMEQFVSCLLVCLDISSGDLTMANAGHYPPLFSNDQILSTESGLVMGVDASESYQNVKSKLEPGVNMLLYTDGVIESMNKDDNAFGLDRLIKIVKEKPVKSAEPLVNNVIEAVLKYRSTDKILDDVTVVSLHRG